MGGSGRRLKASKSQGQLAPCAVHIWLAGCYEGSGLHEKEHEAYMRALADAAQCEATAEVARHRLAGLRQLAGNR